MVHAEKLLGSFKDKSILVLGAGKMSELALEQINDKGANKIFVMNRTASKAENLSEKFCCIPSAFSEIKEILSEVDVCICSMGAPHYILDKELVMKVMANRPDRPLILIDISMPRNIDPQFAELPNVMLSDIDALEKVVEDTMKIRKTAVGQVEAIIESKLEKFYQQLNKIPSLPESSVRPSTAAS
jgi:glutamyl-tRNA reductase